MPNFKPAVVVVMIRSLAMTAASNSILDPSEYPMQVDRQKAAFQSYEHSWQYVSLVAACEHVPKELEDAFFDPFDAAIFVFYLALIYGVLNGISNVLARCQQACEGKGCGCISYISEQLDEHFGVERAKVDKAVAEKATGEKKEKEKVKEMKIESLSEGIQDTLDAGEESQIALFWILQMIMGVIFWTEYWLTGASDSKFGGYPACNLVIITESPFYKPCFAPFVTCIISMLEAIRLYQNRGKRKNVEGEGQKCGWERPGIILPLFAVSLLLAFAWFLVAISQIATLALSAVLLATVVLLILYAGAVFMEWIAIVTNPDEGEDGGVHPFDDGICLALKEAFTEKLCKALEQPIRDATESFTDSTKENDKKECKTKRRIAQRKIVLAFMYTIMFFNVGFVFFEDSSTWGDTQSFAIEAMGTRLGRAFKLPSFHWPNFNITFDVKWALPTSILFAERALSFWSHWYTYPSKKQAMKKGNA